MQDKVSHYYETVARHYVRRWQWYIRNTLTHFRQRLPLAGAATVLDIACGTGELERLVLEDYPFLKLVGIDFCEGMLLVARDKLAA